MKYVTFTEQNKESFHNRKHIVNHIMCTLRFAKQIVYLPF